MKAQQFKQTPTGPIAKIDGVWYSVNGSSLDDIGDIRYALPEKERQRLGAINDDDVVFTSERPTRINARNPHLTRPVGLTLHGKKAHAIICRFLRQHKACGIDDGGGAFLTPAQWARRGELWVDDGVLFILHEGSMQRAFNFNYGRADLVFRLGKHLRKQGFHLELLNGYSSAVYID